MFCVDCVDMSWMCSEKSCVKDDNDSYVTLHDHTDHLQQYQNDYVYPILFPDIFKGFCPVVISGSVCFIHRCAALYLENKICIVPIYIGSGGGFLSCFFLQSSGLLHCKDQPCKRSAYDNGEMESERRRFFPKWRSIS